MRSIDNSLKRTQDRLDAIIAKDWKTSRILLISTEDTKLNIEFGTEEIKGAKSIKDFFVLKKGMQPYEKGKGVRLRPEK